MMHDRFDSLVDLLLAGGLEEAERREAEAHAAGCRPCGALLADARSFRAWATGVIASDAPPADLEDRIVARFRAAKPRRSWPRLARAFKIAGGLAAAVFLIVLGAAFTAPREGELLDSSVSLGIEHLDGDKAGPTLRNAEIAARRANGIMTLEKEAVDGRRRLHESLRREETQAGMSVRRIEKFPGVDVVSDGISLDVRPTTSAGLSGVFKSDDAGVDVLNRANAPVASAGETVNNLSLTFKDLGEPSPETAKPPPTPDPPKPEALEVATLAVAKNLAHLESAMKEGKEPDSRPTRLQDGRKLIRKGVLALEVEAYEAASTRIAAVAAEEKGYVADADTERLANGKIHAVVVVRVPPDRFDAALAKFRALGTVQNQSVTSEDVTKAYLDYEARLGAKTALFERLKKILGEAKGTVKELMEVEVQYLAGQVSMTTIKLDLSEKDLGQPFEVVESLQSTIGVTAENVDAAYAGAQKAVADVGGQVVESRMTRQNDGSAKGILRAKVDAGKFPALREELRKLGHVDVDTVNQQKTARGEGAPKPDAPVRKELALVALTVSSPALFFSRNAQLALEAADVDGAYQAARKAVESAGGKIVDGSLAGQADGAQAVVRAHVDAARFADVVAALKGLGRVKQATTGHAVPPSAGLAPLVRERGEINLRVDSPPVLIGERHGLGKTVRDTFSGSVAGLMWSVEKLFVGISLAGPWIILGLGAWFAWRRVRRKKPVSA
jgi:glycine cleavage system regulatory protein